MPGYIHNMRGVESIKSNFVSAQTFINNMPIAMLVERIAELREFTESKIWGKSSNLLFNLFDSEKCEEIDERAKTDTEIKKQRKAILNGLSGNAASASKGHEEAFTLYNEICVLDMLAQKDEIVRFVPKSNTPTPDFSITPSSRQPVNLELKTLSFNGSDINFRRIEKDIKATDGEKPEWVYQSAIGISQEEMERNIFSSNLFKPSYYCIMDGYDALRLWKAYEKLPKSLFT